MNTFQSQTPGIKGKNGAEIGAIKNDTQTLKDDMETLKKDAKVLIDHAVSDGREVLKDATSQATEKLETAKDTGRVQMKKAEEYVRSNPTQSLAYAFIGGVILSLLMRKG